MNNRFSKSIVILGVVSLLSAGAAFAANGNGNGTGSGKGGTNAEFSGDPANKMARMSEMLGLDADQEDAILSFFRQQQTEREELRALIMETFGDQICAQREANQGEFEELLLLILDTDQLAIHEEMKANREARQAERQNRRGNGGLDCSDDADG